MDKPKTTASPKTTAKPKGQPVAAYLRISDADQTHDSQRAEVVRWLDSQGIARMVLHHLPGAIDGGPSGAGRQHTRRHLGPADDGRR